MYFCLNLVDTHFHTEIFHFFTILIYSFWQIIQLFLSFFAKLETFIKLKILPSELLSAHCSSKKQMFCIFGFVISHMMRLMLQLAWWQIEEEMELGSCVQILTETDSVYLIILAVINLPFSSLPWLEVAGKTGLYSLDWQPIWGGGWKQLWIQNWVESSSSFPAMFKNMS